MAKQFALSTTDDPEIHNLQRNFWSLAVKQFEELRIRWRKYAREDGNPNGKYNLEQFVEDAAVVIVLAGTSISMLLGQNVPTNGKRTPGMRDCLLGLFGKSQPHKWEGFISHYDDLRHFGEGKWETATKLNEYTLQQDMEAAQEIWVAVLKHRGEKVTPEFTRSFEFK